MPNSHSAHALAGSLGGRAGGPSLQGARSGIWGVDLGPRTTSKLSKHPACRLQLKGVCRPGEAAHGRAHELASRNAHPEELLQNAVNLFKASQAAPKQIINPCTCTPKQLSRKENKEASTRSQAKPGAKPKAKLHLRNEKDLRRLPGAGPLATAYVEEVSAPH